MRGFRKILAGSLAVTVLLAVTPLWSLASEPAAVANPGFEEEAGWEYLPEHWNRVEDGRNGGYAMEQTGNNSWYACKQTLSVQPNTTYALSWYAKGEEEAFSRLRVLASETAASDVAGTDFAPGEDWTKYGVVFQTGDLDAIQIWLQEGVGKLAVDDFALQVIADGTIMNPGFEEDGSFWHLEDAFSAAEQAGIGGAALAQIDAGSYPDALAAIPVTPHTEYTLCFFAKGIAGGESVVQVEPAGIDQAISKAVEVEATEDWQMYTVTFNPRAYTMVKIRITGYGGVIYFDDFQMMQTADMEKVYMAAPQAAADETTEAVEGVDLQVTDITWETEVPQDGAELLFTAVVRNNGQEALPAESQIPVAFYINGKEIATAALSAAVEAGGTANVTMAAADTWTAAEGSHTVTAIVDPENSLEEEEKEAKNNVYSKNLLVADEELTAPVQALKAGINQLTFSDDFDSLDTIDTELTGDPGYKWYMDRPFGYPDPAEGDITVSDSVLTIGSKEHCAGWGICTYSNKGDTGFSYRYGYIEARMRFDITVENADYWPAFWGFSREHTLQRQNDRWGELDYFEAIGSDGAYQGQFVGTAHDWDGLDPENGKSAHSGNHIIQDVVQDSDWHLYGCLWTPGRIEWYFDGELMTSLEYSEDGYPVPITDSSWIGSFSNFDSEFMVPILGADESWPLQVDYVRLWQEGNMEGVVIPEDPTPEPEEPGTSDTQPTQPTQPSATTPSETTGTTEPIEDIPQTGHFALVQWGVVLCLTSGVILFTGLCRRKRKFD